MPWRPSSPAGDGPAWAYAAEDTAASAPKAATEAAAPTTSRRSPGRAMAREVPDAREAWEVREAWEIREVPDAFPGSPRRMACDIDMT
ncbi:hypothetical protein GCM10010256_24730 [Streptomyces coeruleorubidus]|nr:hypothetical protein GCM10010256_24730 [Streptomyces coeruleorubidus]